jgi:hypothetical protein
MGEKSFRRGHSYITLLTDLVDSRLLDVVEERSAQAAHQLWETLSVEQKQAVEAVAYLKVARAWGAEELFSKFWNTMIRKEMLP